MIRRVVLLSCLAIPAPVLAASDLIAASDEDFLPVYRTALLRLEASPEDVSARVSLAELYLSRAMLPEARDMLVGLENPRADEMRRVLDLLSGVDADGAVPGGPALRAHAARLQGRRGDAKAALDSLAELPPEIEAVILPSLLDSAIEAEDWETGGALAARFADHPSLVDAPAYWFALGRVAEVRGDPATAFEGYAKASLGAGPSAQSARVALVRMGQGALPPAEALALAEPLRWSWRGDALAREGLFLVSSLAEAAGRPALALDVLGQAMDEIDDAQAREMTRMRAAPLLTAYYEDGRSLGVMVAGHAMISRRWLFEPAFQVAAAHLPDRLLAAGLTAAAAREARSLREAGILSRELGRDLPEGQGEALALTEAHALERGGRLRAALDVLIEAGLAGAPLAGELSARLGLPLADGPGALHARADRAFEAEDWPAAQSAYQALHDADSASFGFRDLVRLILSAHRAGDAETVEHLAATSDGPEGWEDMLRPLLASPPPGLLSEAGTRAEMDRTARLDAALSRVLAPQNREDTP